MTQAELEFVALNTTAIAGTVTSNTATFSGRSFSTPPAGFTITQDSFQVYVNGVLVPVPQRTVAESDSDIVITFDTDAIQYQLQSDFEVVLTGKYA